MKEIRPVMEVRPSVRTRPTADNESFEPRRIPGRLTGAELSIIVPTYNERDNAPELVRRLDKCLAGYSWEVIFVDDDSPDGTATVVRQVAQRDGQVRCLHRIGRRGLSSACIEGMLASSAPYLAVIDGDLQHDETLLPSMLHALKTGEYDVAIGSRYVSGGGTGAWETSRVHMSRFATAVSRLIVGADLKDPMSGFFMIHRDAFNAAVRNLSVIGFKILLDLFASSPRPLRFKELPYEFRARRAGESKLDSRAKWDYGMLLLDKLIGRLVPVRFIAFTFVGSIGVAVHLAVVTLLFKGFNVAFLPSQILATLVAMTTNFALNNVFTYRDVRLTGWRWLRGWVAFIVACAFGTLANVGVAAYLFENNAGWTVAALAGIMVGAVWNYATTRVYTWGVPKS
ncbi:MAG TPA: glycosyltransferase family 2 protein [Candidatus Binatia bacterium]|nr:glycosyltransferase family 2 protein [Candidatus Binatia bacterium]